MPPINPVPTQRYLTRWCLKSGATTDLITEMDEAQILKEIEVDYHGFSTIKGVNDKGWPVSLRFRPEDVSMWIIVPHETYLAARPNLIN